MDNQICFFDLETKQLLEKGAPVSSLDISVLCASFHETFPIELEAGKIETFWEIDIHKFIEKCKKTRFFCAYNGVDFDWEVLSRFVDSVTLLDFKKKTLDYFQVFRPEFSKHKFKWPGLNDILEQFGICKSGKGPDAVRFWREGRLKELEKYCKDDVLLLQQVTIKPHLYIPVYQWVDGGLSYHGDLMFNAEEYKSSFFSQSEYKTKIIETSHPVIGYI